MIYLLLILIPLPYFYFRKPKKPNLKAYDAIIVLGNPAKKDGTPSPIMYSRVEKAAKLYHQGISQNIIFSGSCVANEYSECVVMKDLALLLGVLEKHIYLENESKNTYQNIEYVKTMIESLPFNHCLIITSSWHLRKTYRFTKDLSLNCSLLGADYPKEYPIIIKPFIYLITYLNLYQNLILQLKYKHIF